MPVGGAFQFSVFVNLTGDKCQCNFEGDGTKRQCYIREFQRQPRNSLHRLLVKKSLRSGQLCVEEHDGFRNDAVSRICEAAATSCEPVRNDTIELLQLSGCVAKRASLSITRLLVFTKDSRDGLHRTVQAS